MLKIITILIALLFIYSVPSTAQNSNKSFYKKVNFTALVTAEAVKNSVLEGNLIGIKSSFLLDTNSLGIFAGAQAFVSLSGSSFSGDPLVESDNKTIVGSFGLTLGLLSNWTNTRNDSRINVGFSHISQSGRLLLPDLFGYLKFHQIQNDWLLYIEGSTETVFPQKGFNRLILGARYEIPSSSLAQASVNGQEIKIPSSTRRNFRVWTEVGLFSFVINNSWAITPSFRAEYIHFTQNQINIFQPGVVVSICNQAAEVLRIQYSQESDLVKNTRLLHRISLTFDVINFGRGFSKL